MRTGISWPSCAVIICGSEKKDARVLLRRFSPLEGILKATEEGWNLDRMEEKRARVLSAIVKALASLIVKRHLHLQR
jgi:hypothetical protein